MDIQIKEWLERHDYGESWDSIGKTEGLSADAVRKRCRRALTRAALQRGEESKPTSVMSALRTAERAIEVEVDENNPRIASILEKAEVPEEEFYIDKAVVNEWGWNPHTDQPYYQAKAWLKPIPGADLLLKLRTSLMADLSQAVKINKFKHSVRDKDLLAEINTVDLHIGKRVWAEQCIDGEYNTGIAVLRGKEATEHFLARIERIGGVGQIILPIGHDVLHFDNMEFKTTRGTSMDHDVMYEEMYRAAVEFLRWQIESCASVAPVRLMVVRGNHDWQSVFTLGELFANVYADDQNVTVDNSANPRKYYRWGQTLLGYTHGHTSKYIEQLPMTMADERPRDWADTRFHEWRCGHKHNEFAWRFKSHDQHRTTGIHFLPSLCGTDRWHHEQGFRHHPRAEAHLFHRDDGHDTQMTYTAKPVY